VDQLFNRLSGGETIIATREGAVIRTNIADEVLSQKYALAACSLLKASSKAVADILPQEEMRLLRIDTKEHELVVSTIDRFRYVLISVNPLHGSQVGAAPSGKSAKGKAPFE
jgi:predicted regulator of Ras-like GTPase activity (Roadblock/LC7/MglB family)